MIKCRINKCFSNQTPCFNKSSLNCIYLSTNPFRLSNVHVNKLSQWVIEFERVKRKNTSGARETGKATVRDWARAGGAWKKIQKERAAETPNPKALFVTDSSLFFDFTSSTSNHTFFLFHVVIGFGIFNLGGKFITALTSRFKLWPIVFIIVFLFSV